MDYRRCLVSTISRQPHWNHYTDFKIISVIRIMNVSLNVLLRTALPCETSFYHNVAKCSPLLIKTIPLILRFATVGLRSRLLHLPQRSQSMISLRIKANKIAKKAGMYVRTLLAPPHMPGSFHGAVLVEG